MSSLKFKAIIFDLDGTLIDSRSDLAAAVNYSLESLGKRKKKEQDIIPNVGNGLEKLLTDVFGKISVSELSKAISFFNEYYAHHCLDKTKLYDGVFEFISENKSEIVFSVVTNKPFYFSEKILGHFFPEGDFPVIVGGDSTPYKKPYPEPVLHALRSLNLSNQDVLMIGDGEQDILAAKAAGVKIGLVTYGFGFKKEMLTMNPDFVFTNLAEVKEILT
ncbi:MAG: HAD family hydrolase [Elusimicrobiota bacterium]